MHIAQQKPADLYRLTGRWLTGLIGSWLCVWIAGPWLVNSILVRVANAELGSITLREGDRIRWRSEGWAVTRVGSHGLPGWEPNAAATRWVIWGDSQVEGFCVNDDAKIHRQIVELAQTKYSRSIDCIPLGRSGSDAADWDRSIERADQLWHPVMHVWIITELSDLLALSHESTASVPDRWQFESPAWVGWAKRLHADAAFQAARNLALDPITGGIRSLRFSPGRVQLRVETGAPQPTAVEDFHSLDSLRARLAQTSRRLHGRLLIVYAPAVPRLMVDVVAEHPDDELWNACRSQLSTESIAVIDLRDRFLRHWAEQGEFARGFHNGTPSFGHLNPMGNRLIAEAIVDHLVNGAEQLGTVEQTGIVEQTGMAAP